MKQASKPAGIWVMGIFHIVVGCLAVLGGSSMVKTRESEVAIVAVGLIFVALGIGLIALKPWARNVTIGLHIVNGVGALAQSNGVSLVVVALILQYLFSQKVRELFERNGKIIKSVKLGTEQEGEVTEVYPQTR